jgi:hypothetical protein
MSDGSDVSIQYLIESNEERVNYLMQNCSIYSEEDLYSLLLCCILSDSRQNLAIKLILVLNRISDRQRALGHKRQKHAHFLPLLQALIYLRLNYKQYQKQLNTQGRSANASGLDISNLDASTLGGPSLADQSQLLVGGGGAYQNKVLNNLI